MGVLRHPNLPLLSAPLSISVINNLTLGKGGFKESKLVEDIEIFIFFSTNRWLFLLVLQSQALFSLMIAVEVCSVLWFTPPDVLFICSIAHSSLRINELCERAACCSGLDGAPCLRHLLSGPASKCGERSSVSAPFSLEPAPGRGTLRSKWLAGQQPGRGTRLRYRPLHGTNPQQGHAW